MNYNDTQEQTLKLLQLGATPQTAFSATGTPACIGAGWLADAEFAAAAEKAQALFEIRLLKRLNDDESGAGARWLLERRFPERYGPAAVKATAAAAIAEARTADPAPDTALARLERRRQNKPALALVQSAP